MSGGINLTGAMRSNLLSLNNTQTLINSTQNRLATGLKVSSAIDNPRNFFQAQGLNNRANDLTQRIDGMKLGIRTLQAADEGIKAMTKVVESMGSIVKEAQTALAADSTATNAELTQQYNDLRDQLIDIAKDSGFNGINLLNGGDLTVDFAEKTGDSFVTVTAVDWGSTGDEPAGIAVGALDSAGISDAETAIDDGLAALRATAAEFGNNLTLVRVREDFTKGLVNTLKGGADDLTLADENEEAANLLSLQTRQQLGIQALSLAAQSQQGILRLF